MSVKNIYTCGGLSAKRNLTMAELIKMPLGLNGATFSFRLDRP